jgi:enoyl-CoA hydratase
MSVSQNDVTCETHEERTNQEKDDTEITSSINAIENCSKPVLAAIHGGCIGGRNDVVVACDMRYVRTMRISPHQKKLT